MDNFSIFNIFKIFGIVSSWATTALADGKIELAEAVDLAVKIAKILGVKIEIEVPTALDTLTTKEGPPSEQEAPQLREWVPQESKPVED